MPRGCSCRPCGQRLSSALAVLGSKDCADLCMCVCVLCVNAAATMASARVSADFRTREAHALEEAVGDLLHRGPLVPMLYILKI